MRRDDFQSKSVAGSEPDYRIEFSSEILITNTPAATAKDEGESDGLIEDAGEKRREQHTFDLAIACRARVRRSTRMYSFNFQLSATR